MYHSVKRLFDRVICGNAANRIISISVTRNACLWTECFENLDFPEGVIIIEAVRQTARFQHENRRLLLIGLAHGI